MVNGSIRTAGVTFYTRMGETVARSSRSSQPHRRTRAQFDQRMRMRHTIALWRQLGRRHPMFTSAKTAYLGFASQANRLPAVYVPCRGLMSKAAFLMPGMPVSEGLLPTIQQRLGVVDGQPALVTSLRKSELKHEDSLRLYTVRQIDDERCPTIEVNVEEVNAADCAEVDGCLALTGARFADTMAGWALVRVAEDRCSTQSVVTKCNYYERFTTDEALNAAAETYGGLTEL